ncbi:carbohydrate kinase [Notoacmeibacter sp. MSK16QG-6]|uniref:carbohydrate kinase family protein n=1 Tax=Notoacmeibacter sp. MSK16QG-6 TaxID=2957982 RepID=UPI00209F2DA3|nr:carbohydrate kinase [Notoacmeibacter sp. MSK16QG-6]MCP1198052.1 carbohydrate kinase [Notoacmeibacter sp. MSK16QG-6]
MILCCGEALIDMLPRQTSDGDTAFLPVSGGAVFNTAIALGRLGAPSAFFTGLSTDVFGEQLCRSLDESGVDYSMAARSDRPTTLAFVNLVDGQARYNFYDENTAGRMLEQNTLPDRKTASIDALFFGGISLIGEPAASTYEAFALSAAEQVPVMLDPNIRPGFIKDETTYRARIERMIGASTILKISDEDLAWLSGAGDTQDLARQLLERGPAMVVVTRGAEGAFGVTRTAHAALPSRRAEVVDTVGAGDTFNAGVLCALHEAGRLSRTAIEAMSDEQMAECLGLGIEAAAVTVSRTGANPPWRRELKD